MDHKTWKCCKLLAPVPRKIFKRNATAKSNIGLEPDVFWHSVTEAITILYVSAGHSFLHRADGAGDGGGRAEDGSPAGHHQWRPHLHICWNDLQTPAVSVRTAHIGWFTGIDVLFIRNTYFRAGFPVLNEKYGNISVQVVHEKLWAVCLHICVGPLPPGRDALGLCLDLVVFLPGCGLLLLLGPPLRSR